MPIIGATDEASIDIRYVTIGRLNKGDVKGERSPGREQPYFRFTGRLPEITKVFRDHFGPTPVGFRAYLPYPFPTENFSTWVECWQGSRMLWRSNGRYSVRRWIEERKAYSDKAEDQLAHADLPVPPKSPPSWKGRLNLFFPELLEAGYPGTVLLGTSGKHDCVRIARALFQLAKDCRTRENGIQYIEVYVFRQEVTHTDPDGTRRKHHDVFLMPAATWVTAQLAAAKQDALSALPDGKEIEIDVETGEIIDVPPPEKPKQPAPASPPAPKARTSNSQVRSAKFPSKQWPAMAKEFCAAHPHYKHVGHLAKAVADEGFAEVTDENLDEVFAALERREKQYESDFQEVVKVKDIPEVPVVETVAPEDVPF
jgi:hypothetical protein